MQMLDLIRRKREGQALEPAEIEAMIGDYTAGAIPDYQMAAFLMAVYFRGLSREETAALTRAMVASGEQVDWSAIPGVKVDKHSTGGVADTTTLVLAPLVAAAGVSVVKMSGRGLGHTGGTIDKLESIPGFRVQLEREEMVRQVKAIGLAVTAPTGQLAPADGKLYALRDVTATVESIPLIASSVMSKKIAAGADAIVLDVKVGSGAFMPDLDSARELARTMVELGRDVGRRVVAVITNMDEPLGMMVGNALEVREAIAVLSGGGPRELREVCLTLGSQMLLLAGVGDSGDVCRQWEGISAGTTPGTRKADQRLEGFPPGAAGRAGEVYQGREGSLPEATSNVEEARRRLEDLLASGAALAKFRQFIAAQGGDPAVVDRPELLPASREQVMIAAAGSGYISAVQAHLVGEAAMLLGAGRMTKESPIDLAVGIELKKRRGDYVRAGEPLAVFHVNDRTNLAAARQRFLAAYTLAAAPPAPQPLVYEVIGG
ncbi:thymidine phosphorylase [Moorella sp. Hama-1]|uniref:thymidine phosphorylase n=1 Tax=Moorella sp. Hama-1 TaxID=2138101 RepID=UPI001F273000|nr:thymidine phosphorylase [Moorella sp. Hama-1]BCV22858.1 thymidine phosphorylase [Moorella sp. Hama-1]